MRERRLRLSKIGNVGLWAALLLGLLVVGGSNVSRYVIGWLHGQESYKLAFRDIEIDPAPPKWIKSGRVGLLEEARLGGGHLPKVSMAELDLDDLIKDFKRLPWISGAVRATKSYPNKVVISLQYREPVARIRIENSSYFVDADSVVLPENDIDVEKAGWLLDIRAQPPHETPKDGITWPGDMAPPKGDPKDPKVTAQTRVALGAKIAGFLKRKSAEFDGESRPPYLPLRILADQPSLLFVQLGNGTYVLWTPLNNDSAIDEAVNERKWNWLLEQAKREGGLALKSPQYLDLSGDSPIISQFGIK